MLFTLQRYEFFSKSQLIYDMRVIRERCCLPYKGTNFSANHNQVAQNDRSSLDVVYPTKVRIFQQITTESEAYHRQMMMLFTLQRYEFFSKSQHSICAYTTCYDVVYPTKVRIFQQITTSLPYSSVRVTMLFTLQRYEFFSKSQQRRCTLNNRN